MKAEWEQAAALCTTCHVKNPFSSGRCVPVSLVHFEAAQHRLIFRPFAPEPTLGRKWERERGVERRVSPSPDHVSYEGLRWANGVVLWEWGGCHSGTRVWLNTRACQSPIDFAQTCASYAESFSTPSSRGSLAPLARAFVFLLPLLGGEDQQAHKRLNWDSASQQLAVCIPPRTSVHVCMPRKV